MPLPLIQTLGYTSNSHYYTSLLAFSPTRSAQSKTILYPPCVPRTNSPATPKLNTSEWGGCGSCIAVVFGTFRFPLIAVAYQSNDFAEIFQDFTDQWALAPGYAGSNELDEVMVNKTKKKEVKVINKEIDEKFFSLFINYNPKAVRILLDLIGETQELMGS